MRIRSLVALLASVAVVGLPRTVSAQEKATELTAGIVGLSNLTSNGESLFRLVTGGGYFAAGFYLSPELALEPTLSLGYASSDGYSQTILGLGAALPYYFDKNWGRKGLYLAPRLLWSSYSCTGCDGASQFGLGFAFGTKLPLNEAAALRIQASFDYGFENTNFNSSTTLGASMGLSVFLK